MCDCFHGSNMIYIDSLRLNMCINSYAVSVSLRCCASGDVIFVAIFEYIRTTRRFDYS